MIKKRGTGKRVGSHPEYSADARQVNEAVLESEEPCDDNVAEHSKGDVESAGSFQQIGAEHLNSARATAKKS